MKSLEAPLIICVKYVAGICSRWRIQIQYMYQLSKSLSYYISSDVRNREFLSICFGIIIFCCLCPLRLVIVFSLCFSQQIATQIAVLIAKVARLDCPRQWPELIPILLESVKGQDGLQQHRALLTFYHVTKTLASKRLAQDRRLFQDVSPQFLLFVGYLGITVLTSLQIIFALNERSCPCTSEYSFTVDQQV